MSVKAFYNSYRKMKVALVSGQVLFNIDVHRYRNAGNHFTHKGHDVSAPLRITAGLSAWDTLRHNIITKGKSLGSGRYNITFTSTNPGLPPVAAGGAVAAAAAAVAPILSFFGDIVKVSELFPAFTGKGTPEQIQEVLRLTVGFGLVAANSSAVNAYCDSDIGLDCSGFVGNYCRLEGIGSFGPETHSTHFAPAHNRISKLDAIGPESIIVWAKTNHVAIVDEVEPLCRADGTVHAMVAECSASELTRGDLATNGLNYTEYVFKSVDTKTKVFHVTRGVGKHETSPVWVANF